MPPELQVQAKQVFVHMHETGGIWLEMRMQGRLESEDVYPDASDSDPITDLYEHPRKLLGR